MKKNLKEICSHFQISGDCKSVTKYGNGNIHDSYICVSKKKYLLQKINSHVFSSPQLLMENISVVTKFLKKKWNNIHAEDVERRVLTIIPTDKNKLFFKDDHGNNWRVYDFIQNTICFDDISEKQQGYEIAKSFAIFQEMLLDFPVDQLHAIQPDFHNIKNRFIELQQAIEKDTCNRAIKVKSLISKLSKYEIFANDVSLWDLPLRVVHNDTKVNNVLFDKDSKKPICIVDLDLIMSGFSVYDFGDLVRSATCCKKNNKYFFNIEYFHSILKGYTEKAQTFLTQPEIQALKLAGKVIACELGFRFLTDYLQGDVYFTIKSSQHNKDRVKRQIAYIESMSKKQQEIEALVDKACGKK